MEASYLEFGKGQRKLKKSCRFEKWATNKSGPPKKADPTRAVSDRRGHKAEQEHDKGDERAAATVDVERRGIVDRRSAEKAKTKKDAGPEIPAGPILEKSEGDENKGKKERDHTVRAEAKGTENVAAIKLARRQKIQSRSKESNPGGATHGMEEQTGCFHSRMKNAGEEMQNERDAKDDVGFAGIGDGGNNLGIKNSIEQRGYREDEANKRAGSADVKERAGGPNGGTKQNEGAEGADQCRCGNEERVARADVMMAASKKVPQLMREKNEEQSERKRKTGDKGSGMTVKEREAVPELIERHGLILRVSRGELGAGGKTSAESEKKQNERKEQSFQRRVRVDVHVIGGRSREPLQIKRGRNLGP